MKINRGVFAFFAVASLLLLAGCHSHSGKPVSDASAVKLLSADAYNNFAVDLRKKGDVERAIDYYNKALEIDPRHAKAYNNRGVAWKFKGDIERAVADYNEAMEIDPLLAAAYNNRGIIYGVQGNYPRAIAYYNKALGLDVYNADFYNNRGVARELKGDVDDAIDNYNMALKIDSDHAYAYNNRGVAFRIKGIYDRAIEDYTIAIELNPGYADAYYNRGIAWHAKGDMRQARADIKKALLAALDAVHRWGGVLEHPEATHAWPAFGIPKPPRAGGWIPVGNNRWTCCVEQGHYGHPARKATWLYVVRPKGTLPDLKWGSSGQRLRLEDGFHSAEERRRAVKTGRCQRLSHRQRKETPLPASQVRSQCSLPRVKVSRYPLIVLSRSRRMPLFSRVPSKSSGSNVGAGSMSRDDVPAVIPTGV